MFWTHFIPHIPRVDTAILLCRYWCSPSSAHSAFPFAHCRCSRHPTWCCVSDEESRQASFDFPAPMLTLQCGRYPALSQRRTPGLQRLITVRGKDNLLDWGCCHIFHSPRCRHCPLGWYHPLVFSIPLIRSKPPTRPWPVRYCSRSPKIPIRCASELVYVNWYCLWTMWNSVLTYLWLLTQFHRGEEDGEEWKDLTRGTWKMVSTHSTSW